MEDEFFWCGLGSGFGEPGGTAQRRIPRSTPRENEVIFFHAVSKISGQIHVDDALIYSMRIHLVVIFSYIFEVLKTSK